MSEHHPLVKSKVRYSNCIHDNTDIKKKRIRKKHIGLNDCRCSLFFISSYFISFYNSLLCSFIKKLKNCASRKHRENTKDNI